MTNLKQVLQDLRAGKIAPFYFLHGEEPYYIDLISNFIENQLLRPEEKAFNLTVLYGRETSMQNILDAARRFPVMAQRQVVIVKEAQELSEWNSEKARQMLTRYLERPMPSTLLAFCYKKKIEARWLTAQTHAVVIETKKIYDSQLPQWIKQYFADKGYQSTDKANEMLAEFVGSDLSRIANEIDKLLINFTDTKTLITDEEVARHVGISKEYNAFELQSAIARRDVLKAMRIVNYFASNPKNNPLIPLIALLFGYFIKILQIHEHSDRTRQGVASLLGINPYFAEEYLAAAQSYPREKAIQAIHFLYQADCRTKGIDTTMEEGEILRELVYQLLHL
ncbi:MAG: DNA polymerase III subunit delta [Cytophagales bacterium]|nr:DNA polymerase III subunit delta [Bernardetiaceae bacterium]MDW8210309.1 DNA polymerase III subunit delta [Cytophagales bacterium]